MSSSNPTGNQHQDENYWYQDHVEAPSKQGKEVQEENSIPEEHRAPLNEEILEVDHQGWRRHHAALATRWELHPSCNRTQR